MHCGMSRVRCSWVGEDVLMQKYHDEDWGTPKRDVSSLFEMLTLEGAQAGLSWATILKKREGYRNNFKNFDVKKVALFAEKDVERILQDPGVVRHRGKIESVIFNAKAIIEMEEDFSDFVWGFVEGVTQDNSFKEMKDLPSVTDSATKMSKELKKRGFKFVGPTTCYSFMQAAGLVNDHTVDCFRYKALL
jgi:DNA-3-methyladenine glycosylase I